jgi:hypothetical protein
MQLCGAFLNWSATANFRLTQSTTRGRIAGVAIKSKLGVGNDVGNEHPDGKIPFNYSDLWWGFGGA